MQANTERRAEGLKGKIPDIEKTLESVRFLQGRKVRDRPLHMLQADQKGHPR